MWQTKIEWYIIMRAYYHLIIPKTKQNKSKAGYPQVIVCRHYRFISVLKRTYCVIFKPQNSICGQLTAERKIKKSIFEQHVISKVLRSGQMCHLHPKSSKHDCIKDNMQKRAIRGRLQDQTVLGGPRPVLNTAADRNYRSSSIAVLSNFSSILMST